MQRVIIAGTFVTQRAANIFYAPMAEALDAQIVALAGLGLDHPMKSALKIGKVLYQSKPCQLIGHSQGGVVAALCDALYDVDKIITLGAPLKGVPYPSVPFFNFPGLKFLQASNPELKKLNGGAHIMSICSARDLLVPHYYAHVNGKTVCLDGPGHAMLPRNSKVITLVRKFLDG